MSIKMTLPVNKYVFELEGENEKELFEKAAVIQETLGESCCGKCGSEHIRFIVREVADGKNLFKYFEMACNDCGARLAFGQSKSGDKLFPKRKLNAEGQPDMENGTWDKAGRGWYFFKPQTPQTDSAQQSAPAKPHRR